MSVGFEHFEHLRLGPDGEVKSSDRVAVEEPLEVRLDRQPVAVTMRTPGHDAELALGFLVTEGVIRDARAVLAAESCPGNGNVIEVRTAPDAVGIQRPESRRFYATSSCGICGKASIDAVRVRAPSLHEAAIRVTRSLLRTLPDRLRAAQELFGATGALHAAGLFDSSGELACLREDVGRHNAVDKVIGWAATRGMLPLHDRILLVSGRAGFEIVQKALVGGIPIVAAISGPSSLAVDLAREGGMTLVAFLRGASMNVYSGQHRIELR
jgi:FdhD protein